MGSPLSLLYRFLKLPVFFLLLVLFFFSSAIHSPSPLPPLYSQRSHKSSLFFMPCCRWNLCKPKLSGSDGYFYKFSLPTLKIRKADITLSTSTVYAYHFIFYNVYFSMPINDINVSLISLKINTASSQISQAIYILHFM